MSDFKDVARSDGWRAMKESEPGLEQDLLEAVIEFDSVSLAAVSCPSNPSNPYRMVFTSKLNVVHLLTLSDMCRKSEIGCGSGRKTKCIRNCTTQWKLWYTYVATGVGPLVLTIKSWMNARGIALIQLVKGWSPWYATLLPAS